MANENEQAAPESGGIVTTVRTETTSDLDVLRAIEESKADAGEQQEEPPAVVAAVEKPKPGEPKADTGKPKKDVNDDDAGPIDLEKLTPAERKLVNKAYKDNRVAARKQVRELNERIATLEAQVSEKKGSTEAPPKAVEVAKPVRPKRREFEAGDAGDDKFDAAMEKYETANFDYRKAIDAQAAAAKKQSDEDKATVDAFNARADEFSEDHPDYEEVMDSDVPITAVMFGYMLEEGPELGYYFGKNRDEAEKISKMTPRKQEKACMRIVVKLEAEAEAAKKAAEAGGPTKTETTTVTKKKPEPPKPVAARGSQTVAKDPSKMTFREREQEYARTHPEALNYIP